jgi:hypothetical protein
VLDEVHAAGGRIAPQLGHVGQKRSSAASHNGSQRTSAHGSPRRRRCSNDGFACLPAPVRTPSISRSRNSGSPPSPDAELNLAGWAKKLTGVTAITVGSVGLSGDIYESFHGKSSRAASLDGLLARLERGEFDLVARCCRTRHGLRTRLKTTVGVGALSCNRAVRSRRKSQCHTPPRSAMTSS